jgi:hypothetical protein
MPAKYLTDICQIPETRVLTALLSLAFFFQIFGFGGQEYQSIFYLAKRWCALQGRLGRLKGLP